MAEPAKEKPTFLNSKSAQGGGGETTSVRKERLVTPTATKMSSSDLIAKMRSKYEENPVKPRQTFIYGDSGSGKTSALKTARFPLWIDSFDPGGCVALQPLAEKGEAIIVDEYENEDPFNPTAFKAWSDNFETMLESGVFEKIGTYVLDSATTFSAAVMNHVLKLSGRVGSVPQQSDYSPQMVAVEAAIKRILALKCDIIVIAHAEQLRDKDGAVTGIAPLLTGKSKTRILTLFSEVYYADVKRSAKGSEYMWATQKTAKTLAKSRIAGLPDVTIPAEVPADFKALYQMAKVSKDNLPNL